MRTVGRHFGRCAWFSLCVAAAACEKREAPSNSSAISASLPPSSVPAPSAAPQPNPTPPEPPSRPGCRALAVVGVATVDGTSLSLGSLLDGAHWIELSAGSSVSLRHTQTSREFKLIGPGHVLPCRDGSEQILLADGQLSTSANLGVRPGAEVLIATPDGVVHYGDAALDVEFAGKGLRVRVKQGEAWVEPEERGKPHFKNPVHSGAEARIPSSSSSAKARVDVCESAAQDAEASARRVLHGEGAAGSDSLGARAATHMRDRSKARTACAIAAAAVFTEHDPATRQRLSASVAHADVLWQSVPRGPSGP